MVGIRGSYMDDVILHSQEAWAAENNARALARCDRGDERARFARARRGGIGAGAGKIRLAARLRSALFRLPEGGLGLQGCPKQMTKSGQFTIRSYRSTDREAVRRLCCLTGFLGKPIDPVYEDRELFADFLTTYYTDHEPQSSFVIEKDGELHGYLLGSRRPLLNQLYSFYQNVCLFLRALLRYPRYNAASRRFILWLLKNGWREVPAAPRRTPHFHINLLPDARKISTTRALLDAYFSYLSRSGEKQVSDKS